MKIVGPLLGVALFAFALFALSHFLRNTGVDEILAALRGMSTADIALAVALTGLSYVVLTGYDVLALHYVGKPLPYRTVARISFVSYAISHNIGMSFFSGGTSRYRFYSPRGLSLLEVAKVILFCNLTFWVGFLFLGGAFLTRLALPIPTTALLPFETSRPLGMVALGVGAVALAWVASERFHFRVKGLTFERPSVRIFGGQILVSSLDWLLATSVMWAVLPLGGYVEVLGIFFLAQLLAMVSNVPGGMGVFETVVLFLRPDEDPAGLMAGLVVYRVAYYFLPLVVAVPLLLWRPGRRGEGSG